MAPSSGLIPLSGRQLLLVLRGVVLFGFVAVFARTLSFQYGMAQQMVGTEIDDLLRLRYEALSSGNYRHLAEGLGQKLASRHLQIDAGPTQFRYGTNPGVLSACAHRKINIQKITLCSSVRPSLTEFLFLMAGSVLILIMIRPLISYLELAGILSLKHSLKEAGVSLELTHGLQSLLVTTKESLVAMDGFKEREKELTRRANLGEFAVKMAHDIRSPLCALSVVSSHQALPADAQDLLKTAVERIQTMAESLLDQFRNPRESISQGAQTQPVKHDIVPTLESLIAEKRMQFLRRGPSLQLFLSSKVVPVYFSPEHLARVISNLINNAIEAVPEERVPEIELRLNSDHDRIYFSVSDNGRGIPAHLLPAIGSKGLTSGKKDGTGLGLYQVREFLSVVGGNWDVASEPGSGTTITLSIPSHPTPGDVR